MNYYERHIGDYLKDTAHLSLLEHGVYTRLLDVYYTREGPVPAREVARLIGARSREEREALAVVLAEFFEHQQADDCFHQKRADAEIERFQDKQRKAKASADKRWNALRAQSEGNANASPDAMRTHSEGNAPRARPQSPDTSNQTQTIEATAAANGYIPAGADDGGGGDSPPPDPNDAPTRYGAYALTLRSLGVRVAVTDPELVAWVDEGVTLDEARDAVANVRATTKPGSTPIPAKYLDTTIRRMRTEGDAHAAHRTGSRTPTATERNIAVIAELTGRNREPDRPPLEGSAERVG